MKYFLFTYDVLLAFSQNRFFQSIEFDECVSFCKFLIDENNDWRDLNIGVKKAENGIILSTLSLNKDKVLLFDLTTFKGFQEEKKDLRKIAAIFQKVIRFAVKYFDNLPLSQNEIYIKDSHDALVYPYQYIRSSDVPKVVVDRNSSRETQRKSINYLTAYSYDKGEHIDFNKAILEKAVKDLTSTYPTDLQFKDKRNSKDVALAVTDLSSIELSVSSKIGFENWLTYLTNNQRNFIDRDIDGPERLEGAAGTGKTLTLALRVINTLLKAEKNNKLINIIFFTHSNSTKEMILDIMNNNCINYERFIETDEGRPAQSVLVSTLQEWCASHLGINDLQENEYLDKDAENSKVYQLLYIETAWSSIHNSFWKLFQPKLSGSFVNFVNHTSPSILYELLQKEFSEIIKGQSKSSLEKYLMIERPKYSIPLENETDKRFIFQVFSSYQESLSKIGQFDSDDIVLSALGQIDSPIWNRRRLTEGYDVCFIDETHLFNLNEISIFHFVNKTDKRNNIIFSIDRSQSLGNYNQADMLIAIDANGNKLTEKTDKYSTVFRSSIDIVNLAYSVLSSGASLFTTLENPLEKVNYTFTSSEERKCQKPMYKLMLTVEDMIKNAFDWAHDYCINTKCQRSKILFVTTDNQILQDLIKYAGKQNKPHVILKSRADLINIRQAINDNKFVFSAIDYVGGLEFDAVVIIGVDKNRVPPKSSNQGSHIINYTWYNRIYVAITRAKYAILILGEMASGHSNLFNYAIEQGLITTD